ncbi:helix-turn-helix transcriptional regulator [Lentzea sp. BCCO 10_0856]|uniref:Helix-turn-helix transcriptional regulator n=1 Tax=Lentzea miocenica TaxID=3095431 RepID=A0ABU4SZ85_9PSEU|nr:helix-turn-helix transcriptional regulator [Lentzea sp. BCCO 10_0856]MDX8031215.1 helix-turn-helix transcriptional regulator [Lentzea sp. BCCO 10_0856]
MITPSSSPHANHRPTPQARGRELAAQGRRLWSELGSVKCAAAELSARHPDVPSLQAHRYSAGLSQDQAAARYNEVTGNQTSLGGTTINAWETWACSRGQGSPPSMPALLVLCAAYGRGPLGIADEQISPTELIAEAYERLSIEDQLALKQFKVDKQTAIPVAPLEIDAAPVRTINSAGPPEQVGSEFTLTVPTVEHGNPDICVLSLPNPQPGQLLDLTWDTFGYGVERLSQQIKNLGKRLDADICFGINEAGLAMATFLASSRFSRCPIGYLRCNKIRDGIELDANSFYPGTEEASSIVVCDFEVKHADVIGYITRQLRNRYPNAELYFAVFGAMTKDQNLEVSSFNDLTGAKIMRAAHFEAIFIAATMSPPGIEPPLELR